MTKRSKCGGSGRSPSEYLTETNGARLGRCSVCRGWVYLTGRDQTWDHQAGVNDLTSQPPRESR